MDGEVVGQIDVGLCALIGAAREDSESDAQLLADRIVGLRIFEDDKGKMNRWVSGKDLILYTIGKIGVDGALYKSMEFTGEVIKMLSMDGRFSMANMAIEAGGKNGIIEPDEITLDYVSSRTKRDFKIHRSDGDAEYEKVYE